MEVIKGGDYVFLKYLETDMPSLWRASDVLFRTMFQFDRKKPCLRKERSSESEQFTVRSSIKQGKNFVQQILWNRCKNFNVHDEMTRARFD